MTALRNTKAWACQPAKGTYCVFPHNDINMKGRKNAAHTTVLTINTGNTALPAKDFFLKTS